MSIPNSYPHGYQVAYSVVAGGHALDPAPDESGTARVIDPLRHGPDVDPFQMPFVTMLRSPTQSTLEETPFPPEPGSVVGVSFNMGDPSSRVLVGQPNELNNSQSMPGNFNIMSLLQMLSSLPVDKNMPTKFRGINDKGAPVRAITQEFGDWMNMLTKGLPTHAALAPMAGQIIPAIKEIETAVAQFASILGAGSIGQMPGSNMNMGKMLNNLNDDQKKKITQNMPPELVDAFNSTLALLMEGEESNIYLSNRVHDETFAENAVDLLSQCTTLSDLMTCLQRLRSDTTLHGTDKLEDIQITTQSAYGNVNYTIDHTGKMKQDSVNAQQIMSIVQQAIGLLNSLPAGGVGESMFRDMAGKVTELAGRVPDGGPIFALVNGGLQKALQRAESHQILGESGPSQWAALAFKVII